MKLSPLQIQKLAEKVLAVWKTNQVATFKVDESQVLARAISAIKAEYDKESALEREVHKMLDQLEQSHQGQFERHKMFPLLKQKLAKEKKMIL